MTISRRDLLRSAGTAAALATVPQWLSACAQVGTGVSPAAIQPPTSEDEFRLRGWTARARGQQSLGARAGRVGEMAAGTPYEAYTLEAYIRAGGDPRAVEPLALSLTRFDCVTLVESCLAIGRLAAGSGAPGWDQFARGVERMRYRNGERGGYASRLHYFSEWIADGERRGLVRDLGRELGAVNDARPLRFMTGHRASYPALADDAVFADISAMERSLDGSSRHVVPAARIPEIADRLQTGDVIAFATSIDGLDVSHAAFAYRDTAGVTRVLHAPLSGGVVEITRATLAAYVAAIRRATGILVARPV